MKKVNECDLEVDFDDIVKADNHVVYCIEGEWND